MNVATRFHAANMQTTNQLQPTPQTLSLDTVVAIQLLNVFRNSDHDIDQVVAFIDQHPDLAEETLRRCNSLRFRGAEPVTDIFEAVSRLGFYELYNIVADSLTAQGLHLEEHELADGEAAWTTRADLPPLR
jgi:HD-like signal output (HDOD) protein